MENQSTDNAARIINGAAERQRARLEGDKALHDTAGVDDIRKHLTASMVPGGAALLEGMGNTDRFLVGRKDKSTKIEAATPQSSEDKIATARNQDADPELLHSLAVDPDARVVETVSRNPSIQGRTVELLLKTKNQNVAVGLSGNPRVATEHLAALFALRTIVTDYERKVFGMNLARREDLPRELHRPLATYLFTEGVRDAISVAQVMVENPSMPFRSIAEVADVGGGRSGLERMEIGTYSDGSSLA